eukprot:TRINITY_DN4262_c0_g1_i4.p1 TRINITY_DN4262_c0_g1~~TRINITY_DN4262_c0_g1_i4.p1  ORF type:complete len:332 (-),score=92.83 TRINITY_DN4262_c0_g1_i4:81-1076(-)
MDDPVDKVTLFGEFPGIRSDPAPRHRPEGKILSPLPLGDLPLPPGGSSSSVPDERDVDTESLESGSTEDLNDSLRQRIIQVATGSQGFFKHQQLGDPDLTRQEKANIVTQLLDNRPAVFLQRFGRFLSEDHLAYFEDVPDKEYEIEFYLREARQKQCKYVQDHKIKNRRFNALQKMINEGHDHFSEESMRMRNPLLYDQLIRQYQTEEERMEQERPDMTNCSLSNIIMDHMDLNRQREIKKRLEAVDEEEFDSESEDEEEKDRGGGVVTDGQAVSDQDKLVFRREFVNAAYQSFLAGKDPGIDYRAIDHNPDLDDLALEDQESEERYFDED